MCGTFCEFTRESGDNILYEKKMFYRNKIFSSMLYVILFYYEVLKHYGIK